MDYTLDELVLALKNAYMPPDSPTLREVLTQRHQFPLSVKTIREQYGRECSLNLPIFGIVKSTPPDNPIENDLSIEDAV